MGEWPYEDPVTRVDRHLETLFERLRGHAEFMSAETFIGLDEDHPDPLLGSSAETILPRGGLLLMYGEGGSGKTTLTIDAACHLAAGIAWLGLEVPHPTRVLLIENEGPRANFRRLLREKYEAWTGPEFLPNLDVLVEPWARFTLAEEDHRIALSEHVAQTATEIVVMGPLATVGMAGGGTPDDINAFEGLLLQTRALLKRPLAFWIVHHENKAGDVSGAWDRVPDTLAHVQGIGNGHTKLVWRKARWSSANHRQAVELAWSEGRSFELHEPPPRDLYAEMLAAFMHADGWRTAREAGMLIRVSLEEARKILTELARRGQLRYEVGPSGRHRNARCWRLSSDLGDLDHLRSPHPPGSSGVGDPSPLPSVGGGDGDHLRAPQPKGDRKDSDQVDLLPPADAFPEPPIEW
jgi:AAA domain